MDPSAALLANQKGFEEDLQQLITDIIGSTESTSTEISPPSPQPEEDGPRDTPRKRPFAATTPSTEYSPAPSTIKRPKREQSESPSMPNGGFMHPSRSARLEEELSHPGDPSSPMPDNDVDFSAVPRNGGTAANSIPLRQPSSKTGATSTWSTLQNTIQRQWDTRKSDLEYEELLRHRRKEKLKAVDRYVPLWSPTSKAKAKKPSKQPFLFEKLPDKARDKILGFLLVSDEPLEIDFTWLRPFVKGHARVPVVTQKLQSDDGTVYLAPVSWTKLFADVESMNTDMAQFEASLEIRGSKTKRKRSPARYLTTSLLRVSRKTHTAAARVFYGQNTFHFSYAPAAWLQLDSFLETIGPVNVNEVKHIRIAAPMFHRGMQEDYIEGAILDLVSPATRMAVVKPPPRDRLLSAITHSITKFLAATSLETLAVDLEHPMASDLWCGRYVNDKRLISVAEAERHAERKAAGTAMLKAASDMLAAKSRKPVLTLRHFSKPARTDVNQFRGAMSALVREADKYGWYAHPRLESAK